MKPGFLDKIIERLDRIDPQSLHVHFLRLAKERGLMETVFQAIQEGVIVLEGHGRISYANKAAGTLLNATPDSMLGRPIAKYLREIDWDRILDFDAGEWSRLMSHEIEMNVPEPRFLSFYVVPLATAPSEDKGVLVMLRDVTSDRENEANTLESEKLNAVTLLAAGVAHEIGNPLNALNIHLQLIGRELEHLDSEHKSDIIELLDVAKNEVVRLDLIINQFLRAIRPARPDLVRCRLEDVLKETLALLKHEIENRNIRVQIDSPAALPKTPIDRHQIKQAFFNLIRNAFQAMPDGGALTITLSSSERFVGVSFEDTGIGIPSDEFGHVFEPYHTTRPDGSGLGLMIVQRIVQDHGGAIEMHSEPHVGTTVTVLLPIIERQMRLLKSKSAITEEAQ